MPQTELRQSASRFLSLMMRLRRLAPLQAAQISPSAMAIIDYVAETPYSGIKEIAQGLRVSTPTVSVAVRQLEDSGYIGRQPHPSDKRAVQIFLTEKGQALYDETYKSRSETFEELLAVLEPEEKEQLLDLLEKALETTPLTQAASPKGKKNG